MSELKDALINISEEVRTKVIPENIKAGVQIFDTEGEYTGLDTSDATATASDILKDKTAYVNGEKVTGELEIKGNAGLVIDPTSTAVANFYKHIMHIGEMDTSHITDMENMFNSFSKLKTITAFDTTNVTTMRNMFIYCSELQEVPLLNTDNVTDMTHMFWDCKKLTNVAFTNTSKVQSMYRMFKNCVSLTNAPELDTTSTTNFGHMFEGCTNLTNVPFYDARNAIAGDNVTNMGLYGTFGGSAYLTDESLNNILATCISAVKIPAIFKGLNNVGVTASLRERCKTLPNYQAFLDAGWVLEK